VRYWWSDYWLIVVGVTVGLGLSALIVVAAASERREWMRFRDAHHCRLIGHMDGSCSTGVGVSSNGSAVMTTSCDPDKDGWLCDDGMTYWKDR